MVCRRRPWPLSDHSPTSLTGVMMFSPDLITPHRRFSPLTASTLLVSPPRAKRPWQVQVEKVSLAPTRP